MSRNYIPNGDREYVDWMEQFLKGLEPMLDELAVPAEDFEELKKLCADYAQKLDVHLQKQQEAKVACLVKKESRSSVQDLTRRIARWIDVQPSMNNAIRRELGLNPKGMVYPKPNLSTMRPQVKLEAQTGRVVIHFGENPWNERENGKPRGARGVNIYRRKVGEQDYKLRDFASRSPYFDEVVGPAADYEYVVRYVGTNQVSQESDSQVVAARGAMAA